MPPSTELVVRPHVPLAPRTSLCVGGGARWFVTATSAADVAAAHAWSAERGVPMVVLGGGTNVVVADAGIEGLVVESRMRGVEIAERAEVVTVTAAAGEPWDAVVEAAVGRGAAGLECLSGIPGLVGGTPIQNVGAYGQEVSAVVESVDAFDRTEGQMVTLRGDDCGFAYRTSRFNRADAGRFVICGVVFSLGKGEPTTSYAEVAAALGRSGAARATLADVRAAVLRIRRAKGMVIDPSDPDTRSAGSFFTNPVVSERVASEIAARAGAPPPRFPQPAGLVKLPAAWLIEQAGFSRGTADGAVGLSTKHTLALVTREGATAADVVRFAAGVARRVHERFGVRLRPEPVFLGFAPDGGDADLEYLLGAHD